MTTREIPKLMHRVFISYHHKNESYLREELARINRAEDIFHDCSVSTGDIDENLNPQQIRQTIRRNYLNESTVLLLLAGKETKYRKHVDWELYSSMYNGTKFGRSGVVVLLAPDCASDYFTAPFREIKSELYPHVSNWVTVSSREEHVRRYPDLPERVIDNLSKTESKIAVSNWEHVMQEPKKLGLLIDCAHKGRKFCEYDMSRPMRMRDHNPATW